MSRKSVKQVLMERDGLSEWEADHWVAGMKEELNQLLDEGGGVLEAEDLIQDAFGLEPDYLEDLMGW